MSVDRVNIESALAGLLPAEVRFAIRDPRKAYAMTSGEAGCVANAVEKRQREFSAGRDAARACLAQLGVHKAELLTGPNRAPIWPEGMSGTITHCDDLCLAAVAPRERIAGIGLDVAPIGQLPEDVLPTILNPEEQALFRGHEKRAFCVKEAVYKSLSPFLAEILEFSDLALKPTGKAEVTATLTRNAGPFPRGFSIAAYYTQTPDHIIAASWFRPEDIPC